MERYKHSEFLHYGIHKNESEKIARRQVRPNFVERQPCHGNWK